MYNTYKIIILEVLILKWLWLLYDCSYSKNYAKCYIINNGWLFIKGLCTRLRKSVN